MKKIKVITIGLLLSISGFAQDFDVFYLCIGNAYYIWDSTKVYEGCKTLEEIGGARKSAGYVGEILTRLADAEGIILKSEKKKLLGKPDMLKALDEVIKMAKKSKSKNPLVVFYYCGHGVSEGIAWNQFLTPGDFKGTPKDLDENSLAIDLDELSEELLYLGEITDKISENELPYMCLIDACYEGVPEKFSSLDFWLTPEATQNFKDVSKILRFMNEYHTGNPVVFATKPGTTVETRRDPLKPEAASIGSICRRIILIENKLNTDENISLQKFIKILDDDNYDVLTSSILSNYESDDKGFQVLLKKGEQQ